MRKKLYGWQQDCLERWRENGRRGIVNVVTGAGKTVLAIAAISILTAEEADKNLRVKIVVPKFFLLAQWAAALRDELGIMRGDIGCMSGRRKDPAHRPFMIYVINTARYGLANHIKADLEAGRSVFLIADECHHYGTGENSRIFNFIPFIADLSRYYSLGLSATPNSPHFKNVLVPALGKEIYRYGFAQAMAADIISRFAVFHVRLALNDDEAETYCSYTESLRYCLQKLKTLVPQLRGANGSHFYALLETLAASRDQETASLARNVRMYLFMRKEIVYKAQARIIAVGRLLMEIKRSAKIIIFAERIETSEAIYRMIKDKFRGEAGMYHSEMDGQARSNALKRFESGEIRILISCKALDEGLNIPETDVGIVVSCTGSDRQRIQRLGRILRKGGGAVSCLYYLYVEDTSEGEILLSELGVMPDIPVIELEYIESEQRFANQSYAEAAAETYDYIQEKNWPEANIHEALRNLRLGILSGDWLLPEKDCRRLAEAASSRAEANYYITMVLMIQAREGRLPPAY